MAGGRDLTADLSTHVLTTVWQLCGTLLMPDLLGVRFITCSVTPGQSESTGPVRPGGAARPGGAEPAVATFSIVRSPLVSPSHPVITILMHVSETVTWMPRDPVTAVSRYRPLGSVGKTNAGAQGFDSDGVGSLTSRHLTDADYLLC